MPHTERLPLLRAAVSPPSVLVPGGIGLRANAPWLTAFRRRGTVALLAIALLCPLGMVLWIHGTWTYADELHYWTGNEAADRMPRMRRSDQSRIKFPRYAFQTVGSEYASTRFWTALMSILAGARALGACALPRGPRTSRWTLLAWLVTGLGLVVIGLDERFQGHEWLRVLVLEPSGLTPEARWLRHDVELLLYPLGALVVWLLLYRSLAGDRLARGLLVVVMALGCLAVATDLLGFRFLTRYPNWMYVGMVEELAEFQVGALMAVVSWRHLAARIGEVAAAAHAAARAGPPSEAREPG